MAFPIDEKYIEKSEIELGTKFPESFRTKMMIMNGGEVKILNDCFQLLPFYDTSDKKRIKRTCNSIVHETKIARAEYELNSNLVIVGDNGSGDILVFKIGNNGFCEPQVYFLSHETQELEVVAEDFSNLEKC